jgi:hypothetical protein
METGKTVEWTGADGAGVKRFNASMALILVREGSGVGTVGGAEEPGISGARGSERGVVPSVGSDMVAEQSS